MFRDPRTVPLDDVQIPDDASASPDYAFVKGKDNVMLLHEALLKLRTNWRKAICHQYGMDPKTFIPTQELSVKEIARILGKSEGAVKEYIRRAKLRLKELLGPNLEF